LQGGWFWAATRIGERGGASLGGGDATGGGLRGELQGPGLPGDQTRLQELLRGNLQEARLVQLECLRSMVFFHGPSTRKLP
jgi:hypothetical protein